ncbi:hypothetical protein BX666DRAFT_1875631 [Dichotomocladium elegans]|nr:hypothetical protein BX666DRAFT_1875631 [Dichotomocladium elegans]
MSFITQLFQKRRDYKQKRKRNTWPFPKRWFNNSSDRYQRNDQDTACYEGIDHDLLFHCIQAALFPKDVPATTVDASPPFQKSAKTTDHIPTNTRPTTHLAGKTRKRWSTGMLDDFSPPTKGSQALSPIPEIVVESHFFSSTPAPPALSVQSG